MSEDASDFQTLATHHAVVEEGVHYYYSQDNPRYGVLFEFDSPAEVRAQREATLLETSAAFAMSLLAAIEAAFRVDYRKRILRRRRDALSREFRSLYQLKQERVSFTDDILEAWKAQSNVSNPLIGDIRSAFRYRNWLAHGRYWRPNLGRSYDFETVYNLACKIEETIPLLRS